MKARDFFISKLYSSAVSFNNVYRSRFQLIIEFFKFLNDSKQLKFEISKADGVEVGPNQTWKFEWNEKSQDWEYVLRTDMTLKDFEKTK